MPEPGENQVLIKIRASGMCYTDVHQTRGELPGDFPRTLGHEPVGEIVAVGPGVTTRKTGDRVGVPWVQHTCGRCEWVRSQQADVLRTRHRHGRTDQRRTRRIHGSLRRCYCSTG